MLEVKFKFIDIILCHYILKLFLFEEDKVVKTCSLSNIGTKEFLNRINLVLYDLKCDRVAISSQNCRKDTSFLRFQCKKGYKFADNQGYMLFIKKIISFAIFICFLLKIHSNHFVEMMDGKRSQSVSEV